jgi:hypothetical protein
MLPCVPPSRDLAAISAAADVTAARQELLRLCVVTARRDSQSADVSQLPSAVLARIPAILEQCDPLAEIVLDVHCAACEYSWSLLFDIAAFFWSEIEAVAGRLPAEVDALARAYGWREADILAMDGTRRAAYLGEGRSFGAERNSSKAASEWLADTPGGLARQ